MNVYFQATYALMHLAISQNEPAAVTCSWALVKSGNLISSGEGTLEAAAQACAGYRLAVALPGRQAVVTQVKLPTRNQQQRQAALPYVLQPLVAEPVADLHLAWQAQGQKLHVIGMHRDTLAVYQQQLAAAGLQPDWITPDALLLPWQAGQAYLWASETDCLLRYGKHRVLACNRALLGDYMALVQTSEPTTSKTGQDSMELTLDGPAADQAKQVLDQHQSIHTRSPTDPVGPIAALLGRQFKPGQVINLSRRTSHPLARINISWHCWRWPIILGSCLMLAWLVQLWLHNQQLQLKWQHAQQYQEDLYQEAVPNEARVTNPIRQLKAKLAQLPASADGGDLLSLLHIYHQLLQQQPPGIPLVLQQLDYKPGQLTLTLQIQKGIQLTQAMAQTWPTVDIDLQQSSTGDNGMRAVLRLTSLRRATP